MSLKTTLLVTCAIIATTVSVRSQDSEPAALPDDPVATLRAAGLGDLAPAPPAALELSQIPAQPAPAAAAAAATEIDVSALWYFAAQKDFGRVAAEIKLIRQAHPDWKPPQDLFTAADGGGPEEQPLWDLFAKQDFAGLRARMEEMKREQPGWAPSANLAGKLALAEKRAALMQASDAKDWPGVIAIATANKMLLTCRDLEAVWRTAEALGRSGDENRATETYRYALNTCTTPHDRLATVQKASAVLQSTASLDALLRLGRRQADGRGEFDALRLDRSRRLVGEAANDRDLPPPKAELDAVAAAAAASGGQEDAQLLGWYSYARKDFAAAEKWFRQAMSAGPNAKAAEGLTLSLRADHDLPGARAAALQYAGLGADNRGLFMEIMTSAITDPAAGAVSPAEIAAFTDAVNEARSQDGAQALLFYADKAKNKKAGAEWAAKVLRWRGNEIDAAQSAEGAQELGWQLFAAHDLAGADAWFKKSAGWAASESAAVGLVLTAHQMHHAGDLAARVAQYRAVFPRVAELEKSMRARKPQPGGKAAAGSKTAMARQGANRPAPQNEWDKSADEIVKTFKAGDYQATVSMLDQRRATRNEPRGLQVVRGWALYQKGDWDGAKQVFLNLDGGQSSQERDVGLRVIEMGYTQPRFR